MEFDFLIQQDPRLSIKEAEKILDNILVRINIKSKQKNKRDIIIQVSTGNEPRSKSNFKYYDLITQIRKTGICDLQKHIDTQDIIFGNLFSGVTNSKSINIRIEWENHFKELTGPCRITPSEWELANDIEFYKEESCIESNGGEQNDFIMCTRNYRGFLFSCSSLIDAYINRHIHYYEQNSEITENFIKLKESRKSEERLELFLANFCDYDINQLKTTKEWNDFMVIKNLRNEIIHSTTPYLGVSIKDMAGILNRSILGIGGLLKILQEKQNRQSLEFIERVRTSPIIHYQEKNVDSNGKIVSKKHMNKINR